MRFTLTAALMLLASATLGQERLPLPPRPAGAPTGSQFYNQILPLSSTDREQRIINEIARGNVPDHMRNLVPVTISGTVSGGSKSTTMHVCPDYIAIGSDADFFRMPMSAPLAQQVADIVGCTLPTRKMVDRIYNQAGVKLAPSPFNPANYDIDSVEVFWLSQQAIQTQFGSQTQGLLVGGTKKDVVVTPQLDLRPAPLRVAIYGWHQLSGTPIQPLSLVHENTYEDYSHGIRLIRNSFTVDGTVYTLPQIVTSATLNPILSDEGVFGATNAVYPIPSPYTVTISDNLVVNGSFEEAFVGGIGPSWESWTAPGSGTITFGRASLNKVDGAASQYWARNDTAPFDGGVRQAITVQPGARYRLSARFKRQSTLAGTVHRFGYDATGNSNALAASVVYTGLEGTTNDTWSTYDQTFTATSASVVIFARGGHSGTTGGANAYFYLDAVTMYLIEAAPAPTGTGWLAQ